MIQLSDFIETPNQTVSQAETISLAAIIDTALCVGAGGSSGSQADKPIIKTADGRLVIPASQLKGRLRHECEKLTRSLGWPTCESPVAQTMCPQRAGLSEQSFYVQPYQLSNPPSGSSEEDNRQSKYCYHCLICQIFGNPALSSRIQFSDLVCTEPAENIPDVLRPGVTINRRRLTAEEKKLYFLETSPANAQLAFTGNIMLEPGLPPFAKVLLVAGLKHIHALGGSKSTGLGWLQWQTPLFDDPGINNQTVWDFLGEASKQDTKSQTSTVAGGES